MEPTKKQLDFIQDIAKELNRPFTGTTKGEASEYISANIEDFKRHRWENIDIANWIKMQDYGAG